MLRQWNCNQIINNFFIFLFLYRNFNNAQILDDGVNFRCKNGQIISSDERCDGKPDCADGSDEIVETCIQFECPRFAFRCAYGGCVKSDAECNGEKDCADNSDENSGSCRSNSTIDTNNVYVAGGECDSRSDTFKCGNGQCISSDNQCDGEAQCSDGSDETIYICSATICQAFAFRCGYGACIDRKLKCNGIKNCVDGSDETRILCGNDHITVATPPNISHIITRPPPTKSQNKLIPRGSCLIENIPNLHFINNNIKLLKGDYIVSSVPIQYECEKKHLLDGESDNLCLMGQWQFPHPTCTKYCSSTHLNGVTFQADCYFNDRRISCNQPLRPNTTAHISCQVGYHKPSDATDFKEVLRCDSDGEWSDAPYRCLQTCGEESSKAIPFIAGGDTVNITSVPWQVAVYSNLETGRNEQICGGTIVTSRLVISAAHCFFDDVARQLYDSTYFTIAAGKFERSYTREKYAQYSNISEIYIYKTYLGVHLKYIHDYAILVLTKDLKFDNFVKPACIHWKEYATQAVDTGIEGRVAGWGKTSSGEPSETLQILDVETLSHTDCVNLTTRGDPPTADKFCVRNPSGAICQGDSGGGFLVRETHGGRKKFYLWGIVSTGGITSNLQCMDNTISTFTNIQFFKTFTQHYLNENNPK